MNLLGRAAQVYVPQWVRNVLLARLLADTAAAFGRPMPGLQGCQQRPPWGIGPRR